MVSHKEKFEEFCRATFIDSESKRSRTITRAKGENIVQLLVNNGNADDFNPKTRGFQLITHSALGPSNVLCFLAKTRVSHKILVNHILNRLVVYNLTN